MLKVEIIINTWHKWYIVRSSLWRFFLFFIFQVILTQVNGVNHPSESIHALHVGKMRIKLCKGKNTIAKEYYSSSMQVNWILLNFFQFGCEHLCWIGLLHSFLVVVMRSSRWWQCCSSSIVLASEERSFLHFSIWIRERQECSHNASQEVCFWLQCTSCLLSTANMNYSVWFSNLYTAQPKPSHTSKQDYLLRMFIFDRKENVHW